MRSIDLNCDLGEGYDDGALFPLVTSASIACGGHAGDEDSMLAACRSAREFRVAVGAHPAYPDRAGFGRRDMDLPAEELRALVAEQIATLRRVAALAGVDVRYVKPHGALYNRIALDPGQADAVAAAAADAGLPLLGPAGSAIAAAAARRGVRFYREAFADRAYTVDGRLAPRGTPGAVLTDADEVAERAVHLAADGLPSPLDGALLPLAVDSICLHGDTAGAPGLARAVRARLDAARIAVRSFT